MLSTLPQACIPANPEIAGIGIRASTYAQNFIGVFLAACYLLDGEITQDEAEYIETASDAILMTGCAIIISAIVQAKTIGLSAYHAMIVLNLSWMNNSYFSISGIFAFSADWNERRKRLLGAKRSWRALMRPRETKRKGSGVVTCLGFAHLSLMAGFGIWLWQDIDTFGDSSDCTPYIFTVIFGHNVSAINKSLRKVSLALYWITAIPVVNLLVVAIILIIGSAVVLTGEAIIIIALALLLSPLYLLHRYLKRHPTNLNTNNDDAVATNSKRESSGWSGEPPKDARLGLFYLPFILFLDVLFVIDTELMIRRSRPLVQPGESQWTFGQTLAVIVTIIPLLEARKCIKWKRSSKCVSYFQGASMSSTSPKRSLRREPSLQTKGNHDDNNEVKIAGGVEELRKQNYSPLPFP